MAFIPILVMKEKDCSADTIKLSGNSGQLKDKIDFSEEKVSNG